ncbi:dedicator of cytokinesis protein 3-like isoform 2-T2 [Mantella aurantiaca]
MCLNGVIDAAVNGGITRYQEAFFDKEYITQHPEDADKISQLKELMQEQVHVLGVGLAVHERCVHPEMRPLHKKLVDQFQVMRSSLYQEFPTLEKLNPSCAPPLPRGNILLSHGALNNDSLRLLHRHSPLVVLGSVRHSSSSLSSHASSDTGTTPTAADSENEDPYSMQMLLPHSLHAGSITNVSALSSSYTSPSSSSLSSTHSAPSQLINSAPSSTRGSPSLPDKYRHSRDLVMLLPAPRDRPSSAMYQTGADNAQRCVYPRALFQQVLGPCKPCSDPNLSVVEKVLAAPSSWSLDSGTRESLPFLTTHVGSVLTPTGTPRGLSQGHYSLHFDAFHPSMGDGAPALPTRSLRKSPLHTIPASPTSPQSCLDGSNSPLSGSASSGVSSLSEGNFSGCPDAASSADPRAEEEQSACFQHYPPVRYSLSDPNGLEAPKNQPCRSQSAPSGVTPPRSPIADQEEGNPEQERLRRIRRNCHLGKEAAARVGWEHNMGKP